MYAVIKTGGKQYSVKVGDVVYVEKLNAEADTEVTFDILTYRPKKGSMVRKGHRQPYTKVEITAING